MNIVLLSGGIESAVALSLARDTGPCLAMTFDYGQANREEIKVATRIASYYKTSHRLISLDMSYAQGACAALGGEDVTHTFVPARNLLFLSYGVSLAEATGANSVWFGANKDDHAYYPDCRPAFARCMSLAAELGTQNGGIQIISPFMRMTKREVVLLGQERMVPLSWTTTCACSVDGNSCGKCRGCKQREEAMRDE